MTITERTEDADLQLLVSELQDRDRNRETSVRGGREGSVRHLRIFNAYRDYVSEHGDTERIQTGILLGVRKDNQQQTWSERDIARDQGRDGERDHRGWERETEVKTKAEGVHD